ncbi:MAG: hypothetical protein IT210_22560, partial [Armatimonadetes bacterium]|nr:hypothetical protein [Armatimonadota bacterium]
MEKEGSPKPSLVRHPRSSADVSSCQVVFACSALRLARRIAFVLLLACLLSALLSADPGLPERWGKGDVGSPYSVANLIDGNQTTVIPVVAWQGRGLPVNLTLIHNSHA